MKTFRLLRGLAMLTLLAIGLNSCKKNEEKSRLTVYLTDAPAAYDAVNIEIMGLQVKASADAGEGGWQTLSLPATPVTYNLLDFTNGMDVMLSTIELPPGRVSQLRLILGDGNTLEVNGTTETLPLQVPSGQESGLKFNIHADLVAGIEYKLWIDFDAAQSIVENGTGGHILKPVIRTFTEATSGAIKGVVMPMDSYTDVSATNGIDIYTATPDAATGKFLIRGVPEGMWDVTVHGANGYSDNTSTGVSVTTGTVTDIGTITLN